MTARPPPGAPLLGARHLNDLEDQGREGEHRSKRDARFREGHKHIPFVRRTNRQAVVARGAATSDYAKEKNRCNRRYLICEISICRPQCLAGLEPLLDQPPDRFRTGGLRVRLAVNPGGDRRFQLGRHAHGSGRIDARSGASPRSFLFDGY